MVKVIETDLLSLATKEVIVLIFSVYASCAPLVAPIPVAQPPIPVTMFWAVVETTICPALVPWPLPGVAVNLSSQPVGALLPVAQAAVILRVTPEATVEEY
jgi:hypothetical protein